jgi:Na+/serine symporter
MKLPRINLAVRLILILIAVFLFGDYLPLEIQRLLYAISLSLKEVILFVLPVIIFSSLFSCLLSFHEGAIKFVIAIFAGVFFSNLALIFIGYGIGSLIFEHTSIGASLVPIEGSGMTLLPLWDLPIPQPLQNEYALVGGLLLGAYFSLRRNKRVEELAAQLNSFVTFFLKKLFIPALPFFATGFVVKMQYEGLLSVIIESYGHIFLIVIMTFIIFIVLLFGIATSFVPSKWYMAIRKVLPAGILGFSTMSSMAALPVNITAAESNTGDPKLARVIIPATVNIHLLADRLFIPMMAVALLITFDQGVAPLSAFIPFAFFYAIASFAIAGVPAGGIIVTLPLLTDYLGFSSEMTALLLAIYVMFDPILTTGNVMGNGAFAIIFGRLFKKFASSKG